jgi:hypothetical protein
MRMRRAICLRQVILENGIPVAIYCDISFLNFKIIAPDTISDKFETNGCLPQDI